MVGEEAKSRVAVKDKMTEEWKERGRTACQARGRAGQDSGASRCVGGGCGGFCCCRRCHASSLPSMQICNSDGEHCAVPNTTVTHQALRPVFLPQRQPKDMHIPSNMGGGARARRAAGQDVMMAGVLMTDAPLIRPSSHIVVADLGVQAVASLTECSALGRSLFRTPHRAFGTRVSLPSFGVPLTASDARLCTQRRRLKGGQRPPTTPRSPGSYCATDFLHFARRRPQTVPQSRPRFPGRAPQRGGRPSCLDASHKSLSLGVCVRLVWDQGTPPSAGPLRGCYPRPPSRRPGARRMKDISLPLEDAVFCMLPASTVFEPVPISVGRAAVQTAGASSQTVSGDRPGRVTNALALWLLPGQRSSAPDKAAGRRAA